ncbi:kinase-like domain-containing protein [Paraphysoderma sedebokerense]|nr:kinase-like domain-containing protein [Paraphysoderma sedebokerense]
MSIETPKKTYVIPRSLEDFAHLDELIRLRYQPSSLPPLPPIQGLQAVRQHSSKRKSKSFFPSKSMFNSQSVLDKFDTESLHGMLTQYLRVLFGELLRYPHLCPMVAEFAQQGYVVHKESASPIPRTERSGVRCRSSKSCKQKASVDDYQILTVLGKGCMGKVLLVRPHAASNSSNPQLYALKSISKSWVLRHEELSHTLAERQILATVATIRHPFLIQCHEAFTSQTELFLLLEFVGGGDMATQLAKFTKFNPYRTKFYAAEILLGVMELHRLGIVYRDLKPENILLRTDGHIVLTDFGLSKMFRKAPGDDGEVRTKTFAGTAEYLAPEILRDEEYGFAVDWWSFGTLVYEMLTGITPFWADNHAQMYQRVLEDELEFPDDMPLEARDLLSGLLQRDPLKRLGSGPTGAQEIQRHPYFYDLDWNEVYQRKMRPPYVPKMRSPFDLSNFEDMFTQMSPRLSPPSQDLSTSAQNFFAGYSWAPAGSYIPYGQSMGRSPRVPMGSSHFGRTPNASKRQIVSHAADASGYESDDTLVEESSTNRNTEQLDMSLHTLAERDEEVDIDMVDSLTDGNVRCQVNDANEEEVMIMMDDIEVTDSSSTTDSMTFHALPSPNLHHSNSNGMYHDQTSPHLSNSLATPTTSPSFAQLRPPQAHSQTGPLTGFGITTPPLTPIQDPLADPLYGYVHHRDHKAFASSKFYQSYPQHLQPPSHPPSPNMNHGYSGYQNQQPTLQHPIAGSNGSVKGTWQNYQKSSYWQMFGVTTNVNGTEKRA